MLDDESTITNVTIDDATAEISLHSLALANGLDRRLAPRLRYHHENFDPLPSLKISSQFVLPQDISVGGFSLNADFTPFNASIGDEIRVEISWPGKVCDFLAKVVNNSNNMFRFKWLDKDAEFEQFLRQYYLPALLGSKLYLFRNNLREVDIVAEEIWLGPTGEVLIFQQESPDVTPTVYMHWGNRDTTVYYNPFSITCKGFKLTSVELGQWIVLLNQMKTPSHNINELLELLYPLYIALVRQEKLA